MPELIGKIAGIISFLAFVPYIYSTIKGQTKPNRATWWIWTVVGLMLGASYYASGANQTIWVLVSYIIGPFVVAMLSIKYGARGWNRFDKFCLVGAGVGLFLWWYFNSAPIALFINLFIDFLGLLPTVRKTWLDPESEDWLTWFFFFLGNLMNLFAIEKWDIVVASYPIYMLFGTSIIVSIVSWHKFKQIKKIN